VGDNYPVTKDGFVSYPLLTVGEDRYEATLGVPLEAMASLIDLEHSLRISSRDKKTGTIFMSATHT
jgi:hypothetical protein